MDDILFIQGVPFFLQKVNCKWDFTNRSSPFDPRWACFTFDIKNNRTSTSLCIEHGYSSFTHIP